MSQPASPGRRAPWPALARRWGQYVLLASPAAPIAGLAAWLGGAAPSTTGFLAATGPYLLAWLFGSLATLAVAVTLLWLMARGSGFRLDDLEPERGRTLLITIVGLWVVAAVLGYLHRGDAHGGYGAFALGGWLIVYFNGLLSRRMVFS